MIECRKEEGGDLDGTFWTKIFTYEGDFHSGDYNGIVEGTLPLWYRRPDDAPFDQYLWVDTGTTLDWSKNNPNAWET
ncbi:MAG: hypothetical protein QF704_08785 [Anaerolineales bacterium]|nr:hypothetical protein [Anaerolineales bacterium]